MMTDVLAVGAAAPDGGGVRIPRRRTENVT
jgi:hypothetical protein